MVRAGSCNTGAAGHSLLGMREALYPVLLRDRWDSDDVLGSAVICLSETERFPLASGLTEDADVLSRISLTALQIFSSIRD